MIRRTIRMPTEAEDIEITRAAESDQDALILTNEQLAKVRSASLTVAAFRMAPMLSRCLRGRKSARL